MSNSSHSGHVGGDPGRLDPEKIQKCIAEGDFDVVSDGFVFFKKDGHSRPLFRLFSSFQTNITVLTTNKCEKISIQYTVLGFELTTFRKRVSFLNH